MIKRLVCALAAVAWLVGLSGCASSPSTYRVVDYGNATQWLLPPGADAWSSGGRGASIPTRGFQIDLPLRNSACPYYAKFPRDERNVGAFRGEIVPLTDGSVLRLKSVGMFLDDTSLLAAWVAWWEGARKDWPGECLADVRTQIEAMLVERRPLQFGEMLKLYYGFDDETRTVIIRPGTRVCVTDVPFRADLAGARFSAAGENCATAMSDGHGGADFGPTSSVLFKFSRLNTSTPEVHAIASWAEIPALTGHVFLLRYPETMPVSPKQLGTAQDAEFPLLIAVDVAKAGAVTRAMQCVKKGANTRQVGEFCGQAGFGASSCGEALPDGSALAGSRPKCFRFGERGVLTPYITVLLNGAPVSVPLGTTLGGAMERLSPPGRPSDQPTSKEQATPAAFARVRVTRMFEGRPVVVDLSGADVSSLQLLLLPGDGISW